MAIGSIKPKHWKGMSLKMSVPSQAESRRPRPLAMQIKWHPPEQPWIKINTDGAVSTTGKAGGGGVIRDHDGKLFAAFATPLGTQSALEAELLAISHGLGLAKELNRPMWIESDSEQTIKLFNGTGWGPAYIRRVMARLVIFKQQHNIRASFIHRKGNKAADWLAKWSLDQTNFGNMSEQTP
ncbi:uncharacterized protein LOC121752880 [Salvia splendens]|uniref:uncharacterized protein LOC121752880 n=1 Tax=Salvia splendens TaxID=180675 RepID=UPI001C271D4D|nr:uncharacterized protein LOC121752880 [Salvia splendens]